MIALLSASLDLPPSTNKLYGQRGGQRYKLPEVAAYQQAALYALRDAWQDKAQIDKARLTKATLSVSIQACMPATMYKRRDVDNLAKIVLDTVLNEYLAIDDSRVIDLYLSKRPTTTAASLLVLVQLEDEKG